MGEIKAVTFNIGGTLAKGRLNTKLYRSKVLSYLRRSGFDLTAGDYGRAIGKALGELNLRRQAQLEMEFEEFCSIALKNLGVAPSGEVLEHVQALYFGCFPQTARAGVKKVLLKLSREYKLAAISNSMSSVPRKFLDESGLGKYFRAIVISGEVGYRKPHPKIFESVLEELGVKPGEAVHVGNLLEEDVGGAKGVGMYSVLVGREGLGEGAAVKPDLVVGSILDIPWSIEILSSPELREIKALLGDRCKLCSAEGVGLFKIDVEGANEPENFMPLCPRCRRETLKKLRPRPVKRGKYRAIYRRAWLEVHKPRRD